MIDLKVKLVIDQIVEWNFSKVILETKKCSKVM